MEKLITIDGVDYELTAVRSDLLKKELRVPVGQGYYGKPEPLPYRHWAAGGVFQVYLDGQWQDAESIDWQFGFPDLKED